MIRQELMNELMIYRRRCENPPFELIEGLAKTLDMAPDQVVHELVRRFGWPSQR